MKKVVSANLPIERLTVSRLEAMEYFKNIGCIRTNIEVFGPNVSGLNFYEGNGYVVRDMIVSKKL